MEGLVGRLEMTNEIICKFEDRSTKINQLEIWGEKKTEEIWTEPCWPVGQYQTSEEFVIGLPASERRENRKKKIIWKK